MKQKASNNVNSKLSEQEVIQIRKLYGPHLGSIKLARMFDVKSDAILKVVKFLTYKNIGGPIKKINKPK